ncbi:MAG TPA: DUF4186 domain-containing protein [Pyrinomonadaceae bacterium]
MLSSSYPLGIPNAARKGYNLFMQDVREVLERLKKSEFRSRQRLRRKELDYLESKGLETVLEHAADFIEKRLAPAEPVNDGKQTPWRNHPVFVAQHATATCCRGCLEKWHRIAKGQELTEAEKKYVVEVIKTWLSQSQAAAAE